MKTKRVLCPERLRHVPHRFSWIDQQLVKIATWLVWSSSAWRFTCWWPGGGGGGGAGAAAGGGGGGGRRRRRRRRRRAAAPRRRPNLPLLTRSTPDVGERGSAAAAALAVISYELYCQIQLYYEERGLSFAQIGRELNLDEETVAKWARQKTYCQHLRAREGLAILTSQSSSAGWSSIPIAPRKSSSGCVPSMLIAAESPSSQTMCVECGPCARQLS